MAIIIAIIIVVCLLLGGIVLIQNPKGSGLNASAGNIGNSIAGAKTSTEVVEKWTWYLASGLMVLSIASTFLITNPEVEVPVEQAPAQTEIPASELPAGNELPAQ